MEWVNTTFVDTAALIAVLNRNDQFHNLADLQWKKLLHSKQNLMTTNYIMVETISLIQNRLGLEAVRVFIEDVQPILNIMIWIDDTVHRAGMSAVLTGGKRHLSLVDCVSFEVMRQNGIKEVFTFDRHFKEEGFQCIP